ncbi:MAG: co-chaperone DjlA [Gammaproteobacteria bacterium]
MSWTGKIIGAALGAMTGGPIGAAFGAFLGHQFDRGMVEAGPPPRSVQDAFFSTTFRIMGHIAKADGRVTEDEIRAARSVMHHMRLSPGQVQDAIRFFNEGKQPDFPVEQTVSSFRQLAGSRRSLYRAFVEIQVQAVLAAGAMHASAREIIWRVASRLGVSRVELAQIEALIRLQFMRAEQGRTGQTPGDRGVQVKDAYRVLGLDAGSSDKEVKTAYRRLMSQHHPDKLRARGMPDSMIPVAEEKTREIRSAYETLKEERGMR